MKPDNQPTCTYCHRKGHTAEDCFVRRSNEAIGRQDARLSGNKAPVEKKKGGPSAQANVMFLQESEPAVAEDTVAAFKRTADGETLTKQQRMQNDIEAYEKAQAKPKITARVNPDHPVTRKPSKKKRSGKKSASKILIDALGKRVEKYDLINNLAQAQAGITFGQIARGDIDFAKTELQRILAGKMSRSIVSFAEKDQV